MAGKDTATKNGGAFQYALAQHMAEVAMTQLRDDKPTPELPYSLDDALIYVEKAARRGSRPDIWFYDALRFRFGLLIETKFQAVSGTADQKLPWAVLKMAQNAGIYPNASLAVVVGGEWFAPGKGGNKTFITTQSMLAEYAPRLPVKLLHVSDFCEWFKQELQGEGYPVDVHARTPNFLRKTNARYAVLDALL